MATNKVKSWSAELTVVGLQFRWKREGRASLARMVASKAITGLLLVREPFNEYDMNAIAVYLPKRLMEGRQLGYLSREVAEVLAPKLDAKTLEVRHATLTDMSWAEDDYKTATIEVRFRDVAKLKAAKKPANMA